MTGTEYQDLAMRTNDGGCTSSALEFFNGYAMEVLKYGKKDDFIIPGDLINGVIGIAGEAGECIDIVKKYIFHHHPFDVVGFEKELGDVLWYVAMCCNALNISLDDVMQCNIDKLKKRYPDGFTTEASLNREEYKND